MVPSLWQDCRHIRASAEGWTHTAADRMEPEDVTVQYEIIIVSEPDPSLAQPHPTSFEGLTRQQ